MSFNSTWLPVSGLTYYIAKELPASFQHCYKCMPSSKSFPSSALYIILCRIILMLWNLVCFPSSNSSNFFSFILYFFLLLFLLKFSSFSFFFLKISCYSRIRDLTPSTSPAQDAEITRLYLGAHLHIYIEYSFQFYTATWQGERNSWVLFPIYCLC